MKSISLTVLLCIIFMTSKQMYAQEEQENIQSFKNIIRTNPLLMAFGELNFKYERSLSFKSAIEFRANYADSKITPRKISIGVSDDFTTIRVGAVYKYYAFKKKNRQQGLYVLGGLNYRYNSSLLLIADSITDEVYKTKESIFSRGTLEIGLGYQFVFNKFLKGLTFNLYLGTEYVMPFVNKNSFNTTYDFDLSGSFGIGYSF